VANVECASRITPAAAGKLHETSFFWNPDSPAGQSKVEKLGKGMKDLSDAQLVLRYARRRDEGAFAEIVRRHGAMVYATCRRSFSDPGAADDATQAVFMLLARKAGGLSRTEALAGWLHGAARLVAREGQRAAGRRRRAEKEAAEMRAASKSESSRDWESVRGELDAAIEKLPRHYRNAVLLSCVEGRSEAEVARELAVPAGTVKSRVSRGLEKLRERLAQRGQVLGVAALATLLAEHGTLEMSTALATKVAGLGAAGAAVAGAGATSVSLLLMEGALKAMMMAKLKLAAAVIGAALVLGTAVPLAHKLVRAGEARPPASGTKGVAAKPADGIHWGKAVKGLQAGLVPMGSDAAAKWRGQQCRKCRKFNKMLVRSKCTKCGAQCHSNRKIKLCLACATAGRVCQACEGTKPWSATFIEGQPLKLEVHLKNAGSAALKTSGYALLHARWQPVWQIEASDGKRTFVSRPATPQEHIMVMPGMVFKAPDVRKPGWHWGSTVAFYGPGWRFMPKGKTPAATDPKHLPAGKWALKITFSSSGGGADKTVWKGKTTSAAVQITIKAKGAAGAADPAAGAGAWQNLFAAKRWYKSQKGTEQIFKGKLIALKRAAGMDTTLQRTSHYKLGDRTIYTGAKKLSLLDKLVGKNVEIRGKPVNMSLEGRNLKEIWPAAVRAAK
jgi:RNA polymerase sigma factor (sigma-70 family)